MAPQFFPGCAPGGYLRNSSMIFNSRKSEKVYEKFKLKQKKSLQWLRMNANKDERRKTYSRISILGKILYLLINLWCKHLRYDIKSRTNFRWQSSYLCLIYNHTRDNFKYCQEIECSSIFRCWQGPDKGGSGGQCPGTALLVKRSNSNWSFTNEPEVRFRFGGGEDGTFRLAPGWHFPCRGPDYSASLFWIVPRYFSQSQHLTLRINILYRKLHLHSVCIDALHLKIQRISICYGELQTKISCRPFQD